MRPVRTLTLPCFSLVLGTALLLAPALPGCSKKSEDKPAGKKTFTVKEVGVKLTAPDDWDVEKKGHRWAVLKGFRGVFLERDRGPVPASAEEAAKRFAKTQVLASEKLPGGGLYLFYQMDFAGSGDKEPKWLKYVWSIVPLKEGGAATCTVQLLEEGDQQVYEPICKSLRSL
jgi:hypothetical protein